MRVFRKVLIAGGLVAAASGAAHGIHHFTSGEKAPAFRFATVSLARIDQTIARQGVADATVRSARVALERAKQNLSFTSI